MLSEPSTIACVKANRASLVPATGNMLDSASSAVIGRLKRVVAQFAMVSLNSNNPFVDG